MAKSYAEPGVYGLFLRILQILVALLTFILGIVCAAELPTNDPAFAIVAGIFGMIFYVMLVIPRVIYFMSPAILLAGEIWVIIWYIISLGIMAQDFGGVDCSVFRYYGHQQSGCRVGKGLIGLSVIGFIEGLVSLALLSAFSIHPLVSSKQSKRMVRHDAFFTGGLVLKDSFVSNRVDLEKGEVVEPHTIGTTTDGAAVQTAPVVQSSEPIVQPREPVILPAPAATTSHYP